MEPSIWLERSSGGEIKFLRESCSGLSLILSLAFRERIPEWKVERFGNSGLIFIIDCSLIITLVCNELGSNQGTWQRWSVVNWWGSIIIGLKESHALFLFGHWSSRKKLHEWSLGFVGFWQSSLQIGKAYVISFRFIVRDGCTCPYSHVNSLLIGCFKGKYWYGMLVGLRRDSVDIADWAFSIICTISSGKMFPSGSLSVMEGEFWGLLGWVACMDCGWEGQVVAGGGRSGVVSFSSLCLSKQKEKLLEACVLERYPFTAFETFSNHLTNLMKHVFMNILNRHRNRNINNVKLDQVEFSSKKSQPNLYQ